MEQTTSFKQDYQKLKKDLKNKIFKPDPVPHELPKEKMEPALKKAVEEGQPHKAYIGHYLEHLSH